jgi:WD40 repeat protein
VHASSVFAAEWASLAMEQELIVERTRAVAGSGDRTLRVWDLQSAKEIITSTGEGGIFSCAFAPDGRTNIAGGESGRVHFLRLVEVDTKTQPPIIGKAVNLYAFPQ